MTDSKIEIPGLSPASIKMDLIRFKDEMLKDIRSVQLSLDDKYSKADNFLKQKISQFELKINSMNKKVGELSNLIVTDNSIREKVESLEQFKEEIRDTIFKRRAKFNELEKKVNDDINRINHILTISVIYPSLIGKSAKFKTFHDFMDYVLQEIAQLCIFKDKSGLDLTPYKRKIDQTVDALKIQMNNFVSKEILNNAINKSEENIKSLLKIYDDRLQDTRVENSHYAFGLEKKAEEINKQIDNLYKMEKRINKYLENQHNNENLNNHYDDELSSLKNRLDKINEIINELLEYHPASKKNFMNAPDKKAPKIYSGVKQYIRGNLNANELTTMKKFTYEKSKTKVLDKSSPSPTISSFPSGELLKNNNYEYQKRNSNILNNTLLLLSHHTNNTNNIKDDNNSNNNKIDKRKAFFSQKSFNNSNMSDSLTKRYNEPEPEIFNDINRNEKCEIKNINKNMFFRRKTYNFAKLNSLEISKMNNEIIKDYDENKIININNKGNGNIIIEEKNKMNNIHLYQNKHFENDFNDFNDSVGKDKDVINKEKVNENFNSLRKSNKKENSNNSQFVIKEEDENILSDNSYKHIEINSKKKTKKNKSVKNNSEDQIDSNKKNNNNNDNNLNKSMINNDDKIKNLIKSENSNLKRLKSLRDKLNSNFADNNNIKVLSVMKKVNPNNLEQTSTKLLLQDDYVNNNKIIPKYMEQKNIPNEKNDLNLFKKIFDNNTQKPHQLQSINLEMKNIKEENIKQKNNKNNSSYPKTKGSTNNTLFQKNNIPKPKNISNYSSLDNNNVRNNNNNPISYNYKPNYNNNIMSINKINKTYTSFPKINQDLSEHRIQKNSYVEPKEINIFSKTLSAAKFSGQGSTKVAAYVQKPKKVLLTSPDNIPPNGYIKKKNRSIIKNNSFGVQSEKVDKTKKLKNLYNNNNLYY